MTNCYYACSRQRKKIKILPRLPHHAGYRWTERLVNGDAVEAIEKDAELWRPDLMVFTTEGHRDFFDALRGSTTERVLRASHCPVLAVPAKEL
jgi:nucleotide-binding universal stress UspA family protein